MEVALVLAGIIVGCVIMHFVHKIQSKAGILRIDHSNPEKDIYRFEIEDLDSLASKKYVVLKIDHDAALSQN